METVLSELSKPIWWVTVVIAGIIINLIAAYSKPIIDKIFSSFSNSIRNKNKLKEEERLRYIDKLLNDKNFYIEEQFSEMRLRVQSTYALVCSIFVISFR